jgi:photosystem II stability/assembly factor-like uncharacterized protein
MRLISTLLFSYLFVQTLYSQWVIKPGSPEEEGIFRFDDVFFSSEDHGSLISPNGNIYTTWDGGQNWTLSTRVNAYLRAVEYADAQHGLASSLQGPMVRTKDGGRSWEDITHTIPGDHKGMCGLHYVQGRYYGAGVFHSPARLFRSFDLGSSWEVLDLDTIAFGLVDVHFMDSLRGFLLGTGPEDAFNPEVGSIWYTEDGGDNWRLVGSTNRSNTYIWKLFFVSQDTLYASVENYLGNTPAYMYSFDAGQTWSYKEIPLGEIGFFDAQALGFINPQRGWLAGYGLGMYETNDGGNTWETIQETANINRFFKVGDLLLAAGLRLYQLDNSTNTFDELSTLTTNLPHKLIWRSSNPMHDVTAEWDLRLDAPSFVLMGIYDQQGRLVRRMDKQFRQAGIYSYSANLPDLPRGIYFLSARTYDRHLYLQFVR